MDTISEEIKNEYFYSRSKIQLTKAEIKNISANKFVDKIKGAYTLNAHFFRATKILTSKKAIGYFDVNIIITDDTKNKAVEIAIKSIGYFDSKDDFPREAYQKLLSLQAPPQLLPYLRSAAANIAIMLNIPPITLPTFDIINSIKENKFNKSEE